MHCGKKWWIREFVAPYIFPLNPDYVAARSLRSLRSNKEQYQLFLRSYQRRHSSKGPFAEDGHMVQKNTLPDGKRRMQSGSL